MTTPTLDADQLITRLARKGTGVVRCEPGDTLVVLMTDEPEQDLTEALTALLPDHPIIVLWGSPGALVVPPARPPVMLGLPGVGAPECVGCSAPLWAGVEPQEISHDDDCPARPVTGAPYAPDAFNPDLYETRPRTPQEPDAPAYVHRMLDALLTGQPLDFDRAYVPMTIRLRLEDAGTEGRCPTCQVHGRITTGMVCQTCGTDYGPDAPAPVITEA